MRLSDTTLGAVLLVLGLAITLYARTLPDLPGQQYGASVFPMLIGIGFAGGAVVMMARGIKASATPLIRGTEWTRKPGALVAVAITIACIVAYILLAQRVGFVPMSIAILLILFRMLGVTCPRTFIQQQLEARPFLLRHSARGEPPCGGAGAKVHFPS